jgi:hypothetical protein
VRGEWYLLPDETTVLLLPRLLWVQTRNEALPIELLSFQCNKQRAYVP